MCRQLESAPDHATFRASHAADDHARVVLDLLWNEHARLCSASGVRAGHGACKTGSARVAKLLDGAPCAEAGIAGLAIGAIRVVARVLIKRNGVGKVRATDDIAAATAVVFAEVPGEGGLAESTCLGRLIRL